MMNATQVFLTIVAWAVIVTSIMFTLFALLAWLDRALWRRADKRRLEAQKEQEPQEQPRIDFVLAISGLDEFQAGLAEIEAAFERIAEKGAAIESPITINNHYNAGSLQWPSDAPLWEWVLGTDANAEPVEEQ